MVVKRTLFVGRIAFYQTIIFRRLVKHRLTCTELAHYYSNVIHQADRVVKSRKRIWKLVCIDHALLVYASLKETYERRGVVVVLFHPES